MLVNGSSKLLGHVGDISTADVLELGSLEQIPHALLWVEFGRIPRQALQMELFGCPALQKVFDYFRPMDRRAIPDHSAPWFSAQLGLRTGAGCRRRASTPPFKRTGYDLTSPQRSRTLRSIGAKIKVSIATPMTMINTITAMIIDGSLRSRPVCSRLPRLSE